MNINPTHADKLGQLFVEMFRHYQAWAKKHGIHYNQLAVLHCLIRYQACTQKQICEEWSVPKQTISTICKQYLDEGLLTFVQTNDKREKLLSLTDRGRAFAEPIIQRLDETEQQIFVDFGIERSEALLQELTNMSSVFEKYLNE